MEWLLRVDLDLMFYVTEMCYIPSVLNADAVVAARYRKRKTEQILSLTLTHKHNFCSHFMSVSRLIFSKFLVFINVNLWCIVDFLHTFPLYIYPNAYTQFKEQHFQLVLHTKRYNIPLHKFV